MRFDPFVIPFCIGILYLGIVLIYRIVKWIRQIPPSERKLMVPSILSIHTVYAIKECFQEGLLHRKIFRINPLLGYMHMSLAFGWFLLIVVGKLEAFYITGDFANEFYFPVFLKFFETPGKMNTGHLIFNALMDALLLFTLSGVALAFYRRLDSKKMGLKSGTKHSPGDRRALAFLWMIFPLRLLAESLTASYAGNGSFLTQSLGNLFVGLPVQKLAYVSWWAYSISLGGFFIALPDSRYMHIPMEILLIFLRNWGAKFPHTLTGMANIELNSCSRCGICIDPCQIETESSSKHQMVYFLRDLRYDPKNENRSQKCLLCGRCQDVCPVGIKLTDIRLNDRHVIEPGSPKIPNYTGPIPTDSLPCKIVYFAGCMGKLTPGIQSSMEFLLKKADINYDFMDKELSYCCGRPSLLAGHFEESKRMSENLRSSILASGASTLVTSCPICYKSLSDSDFPNIQVLHHSEFLWSLVQEQRLLISPSGLKVTYHDPCELGRKSGIRKPPRDLLRSYGKLLPETLLNGHSPCCGGSLGNLSLSESERVVLQRTVANKLNENNPDLIATACPLCKKSLAPFSNKPVKDLAELLAENIIKNESGNLLRKKKIPAVFSEVDFS